jgi:DNA-binding NarL/FixJ family response regulator
MTAEKRQQPKPVRVSIVEDDRITRESVDDLVRRAAGLELVAAYPDAETALHAIPADPPDVVVMDLNLAPPGSGRLDGAACVAALAAAAPGVQVLMLTVYDDERVFEALRAGASGYILKRTPPDEILAAIAEVHRGGAPMSLKIARRVVESFRAVRPGADEMTALTPREREILSLLSRGSLYKEIAAALGVSQSTVRAHLHSIYGKLHVRTRTEAVLTYLAPRP